MHNENTIQIQMSDASEANSIETMWKQLEPDCDASFFQSWGWIGSWIRSLQDLTSLKVLSARVADTVVGLALIVPQNIRRHGFLSSRALFLQETGLPKYDFIVEHNGFLLKAGTEAAILTAMLEFLIARKYGWDELFVSGIRSDNPLLNTAVLDNLKLRVRVLRTSASRYVDLSKLRATSKDYLTTLSSNTRYQIRRAIRKYEERGKLELKAATSLFEALQFFEQLKELHQTYWTKKGIPGSFARKAWEEFHRDIIKERFSHGEIQLIRISVGETAIGYLYNFVRNGWVYALQSGFLYDENNHALHPGYVSHYLAIEYNLKQEANFYDFLAGDGQYKSSLANGYHELQWVVIQRKRLKFLLEDWLRNIANLIKQPRNVAK